MKEHISRIRSTLTAEKAMREAVFRNNFEKRKLKTKEIDLALESLAAIERVLQPLIDKDPQQISLL